MAAGESSGGVLVRGSFSVTVTELWEGDGGCLAWLLCYFLSKNAGLLRGSWRKKGAVLTLPLALSFPCQAAEKWHC